MRFLRADRLFNGQTFLESDAVLVLDDALLLHDITSLSTVDKDKIDYHEGIITPGFVNAHCHLELSHLLHKIPKHTGLPEFGKQVIIQRDKIVKEEKSEQMFAADTTMWQSGIVAVGDISNGSESFNLKTQSKIHYHTFLELIGLDPKKQDKIMESASRFTKVLDALKLPYSFAAHAAYSTSAQLTGKLISYDENHHLPFSIHNQESEEETKFLMGMTNKFWDLFEFLKIDISWFKAPLCSGVQTFAHVLQTQPAILVHNTVTEQSDIDLVDTKNVFWCFCPNANKYIENRLPNFKLFENQKSKICIGTDSLASNSNLDLIHEVNVIREHSAVFSSENLLAAITSNSARALRLEDKFGTFILGKNVGLNLIRDKNSKFQFIKKIV